VFGKGRAIEMRRNEAVETSREKSSGVSIWYIVGGAALLLVATGVLTSLHDIRRYLRIRAM
jgi:hypothetical protein